ncbi:MAG: hypothetical protein ABIR84_09280 [Candidatus Nitrotoga sp.]
MEPCQVALLAAGLLMPQTSTQPFLPPVTALASKSASPAPSLVATECTER